MTEIEYNSIAEEKFAEFLYSRGYPRSSILFEPVLSASGDGKRYQPDFLIVDPVKKVNLALIEVKVHFSDPRNVFVQLEKYKAAIGDKNLPLFMVSLVSKGSSNNELMLTRLTDDGTFQSVSAELFPSFEALKAGTEASDKTEVRKKEKTTRDTFAILCWVMAVICAGLVILDFVLAECGIVVLTSERMIMIAGCVALVVIPFSQKLKGLGLEWERVTSKGSGS